MKTLLCILLLSATALGQTADARRRDRGEHECGASPLAQIDNQTLYLNGGEDKSSSFPDASTPVYVTLWSKSADDNDTYFVLQSGTTTYERNYLAFLDFDSSVKWLVGKNGQNGPNSWIHYDSVAGIHRIVMPSAPDRSGGPTYIAGGNGFPVIINGNTGLDNQSATGGFEVWGGGRGGDGAVRHFVVTDNGNVIVSAPHTPSSASEPCTAGQIAWDSNFDYTCVAPNTWKRAPLSTW